MTVRASAENTHPAISVWSVAACSETGDIVTGASDRIARVFSRSPDRHAAPEAVQQFDQAVKESAIPDTSNAVTSTGDDITGLTASCDTPHRDCGMSDSLHTLVFSAEALTVMQPPRPYSSLTRLSRSQLFQSSK
jgi:hypothetical protein